MFREKNGPRQAWRGNPMQAFLNILSKRKCNPLKSQITGAWKDPLALSVKNKLRGANMHVMRPVRRLLRQYRLDMTAT